jgi:hypothetical protein
MNDTLGRKSKLQAIGERAPISLFVLAIAIALSFLVAMITKMVKDEDTQGVYYGGTPEGYRKRYAQMMGGGGAGAGGNGTQSTGYGKGRPSPPASALKAPGAGGGYAGR